MPSKALPIIILMLLLFFGQGAHAVGGNAQPPAPEPVRLTAEQGRYPLGFHLEYLADPGYQLTIDDVTSPEYDAEFVPGQAEVQNIGYVKAAYWVRFQVQNDTAYAYQWLLEIAPSFLDRIDVYHYSIGEQPQVYHLGDYYPFEQRGFNHRNFVLDLLLPPGTVHTFYVRLVCPRILFEMYMWNPATFLQHEAQLLLWFGLFYGAILILIIYNLLLFVSVKEVNHLYYAAYAGALFVVYFSPDGFGFQYIWPNQIFFQNIVSTSALSASTIILVLLTIRLLRVKDLSLLWYRLLWGVVWVAVGCNIGLLIASRNLFLIQFVPMVSIVTLFLMLFVGSHSWWRGYKPARFYLSAWGIYLIAGFVPLITLFAWLPANNFTQNISRFALIPALLLLSLSVVEQIKTLKDEKETAQAQVLNAALENQRLVQEQNITLEKLVAERTEALVEANQAKTAFLANVSHELRTPLGLVEAAVDTLRSKRLDLDEATRRFSLETIADETRQLTGMVDNLLAAARLEQRHIKLSLSRCDVAALVQEKLVVWQANYPQRGFNLHKPAEPVRVMLDVVQIQLVLRNLLQNAVKYSPADTPIAVTITADDEAVLIAVQDQGYGISPTDQEHIFERFYRGDPEMTHTIRGAGLGLAICHEIVSAHSGCIWLESQVEQGSTFYVQLPRQPVSQTGMKS